jgi:hypothetical protein
MKQRQPTRVVSYFESPSPPTTWWGTRELVAVVCGGGSSSSFTFPSQSFRDSLLWYWCAKTTDKSRNVCVSQRLESNLFTPSPMQCLHAGSGANLLTTNPAGTFWSPWIRCLIRTHFSLRMVRWSGRDFVFRNELYSIPNKTKSSMLCPRMSFLWAKGPCSDSK